MHLEEYIASMKARLDRFEKHWKEKSVVEPDFYPMEMGEGDWDDQFIFAFGDES
ncbi:hypothetical protein RCAQUAPHINA_24 [Rhodobacter phage RcAquaphina]|nr:hypothetical protein RCAQUAPHINA_24 [Rhodobacter phage RcAquaphina]